MGELIVRLTDPTDPMPPEGKGDMLPATDVQKIRIGLRPAQSFRCFMITSFAMANNLGLILEINAFLADGSLLPSDQLGTKARLNGFPSPGCPAWRFWRNPFHRRFLRGSGIGRQRQTQDF